MFKTKTNERELNNHGNCSNHLDVFHSFKDEKNKNNKNLESKFNVTGNVCNIKKLRRKYDNLKSFLGISFCSKVDDSQNNSFFSSSEELFYSWSNNKIIDDGIYSFLNCFKSMYVFSVYLSKNPNVPPFAYYFLMKKAIKLDLFPSYRRA